MDLRMHKKHTYSSISSIQVFSFRRDGIGVYHFFFFFLPGRNRYEKGLRDGTPT